MTSQNDVNNNCNYNKISAGIVLFEPDVSSVQTLIDAMLRQLSHVFIIDNTPKQDLSDFFQYNENVTYVPNNANLGIAKALNQLMEQAEKHNFSWLLTLDQDSFFPENGIFTYRKILSELPKETAIICPLFTDRKTGKVFGNAGFVECCITSGALTSVKAWKTVSGFDEWFFIDLVDFEFCARLRKSGYKIYQTSAVTLSHQIGSPKEVTIFGHTLSSSNHSAMRYYYQSRNYLVYKDLYDLETTNPSPKKLLIKTLLVDDNKVKKITLITKGIIDGKREIKRRRALQNANC